jgi:hypothetical protein
VGGRKLAHRLDDGLELGQAAIVGEDTEELGSDGVRARTALPASARPISGLVTKVRKSSDSAIAASSESRLRVTASICFSSRARPNRAVA